MKNKKNNNNLIQLKNWLWNKPLLFTGLFFAISILTMLIYAGFAMIFNIEYGIQIPILLLLVFGACTWCIIKKLPHKKMNQNDFIAITNGATSISVITSFIIMICTGLLHDPISKTKIMLFFISHKIFGMLLLLLLGLFSLYLIGLAVCNIYAKYKRATTIGIASWKVILSMPFAFLLMWTPGYLLKDDKEPRTNLQIKSTWYFNIQKWVMMNPSNILFAFVFLLFCRGIITGLATFILYVSLLIIYALWFTKYKSDFIKNINKGYAMTSVGINIAISIAVIIGFLGK